MRALLFSFIIFSCAFMLIVFLPSKTDVYTSVYMQRNKVTNILGENSLTGTVTSLSPTSNTSSSSTSTSTLDNEWWSLGYHPYAFVKDVDPKGAPNCEGYKLTYTQSSNYLQISQGNPNGFKDTKYGGDTICGLTSCAMIFSSIEQKPWDTSMLDAFGTECGFTGSYSANVGNQYVKKHLEGRLVDKGPAKATDEFLKELLDKGAFIVFTITGTNADLNPRGNLQHIETVHGYLSKDGKVEYFIVGDPNGGPTYHNIIAKGSRSFVIGEYLYAIKAEDFCSRNVGQNYTGFYNIFIPEGVSEE